MDKFKQGFAPVETVLAIVLLAIVSVTTFGQFGDPSKGSAMTFGDVDAKTSSAAAINYTARMLDPVAFIALETRSDCDIDDSDADFASTFIGSGLFSAGTDTTCR